MADGTSEMQGMVENWAYQEVARPKVKLVVSTKMLYRRKVGGGSEVDKK